MGLEEQELLPLERLAGMSSSVGSMITQQGLQGSPINTAGIDTDSDQADSIGREGRHTHLGKWLTTKATRVERGERPFMHSIAAPILCLGESKVQLQLAASAAGALGHRPAAFFVFVASTMGALRVPMPPLFAVLCQ
jgi:hypothetical protein